MTRPLAAKFLDQSGPAHQQPKDSSALESVHPVRACLSTRALTTYNANKPASEWHDGHTTSYALQQDILDWRKGKPQVRSKQLEDAEAHEAGWHRHDRDPSCLQAKIHIGEANNGSHR